MPKTITLNGLSSFDQIDRISITKSQAGEVIVNVLASSYDEENDIRDTGNIEFTSSAETLAISTLISNAITQWNTQKGY